MLIKSTEVGSGTETRVAVNARSPLPIQVVVQGEVDSCPKLLALLWKINSPPAYKAPVYANRASSSMESKTLHAEKNMAYFVFGARFTLGFTVI